jgi:protein CpxP
MNFMSKMTGPALLLALMLPVAASAQMMASPPGMGHPGMGQPGAGQLEMGPPGGGHAGMRPGVGHPGRIELSEAQQDKAFALKHGQEPLRRELLKAVQKAREAMHTLAKSGEFDEKKAGALAQTLGQAVAALEMHQARSHAQFVALLTPEQRKQLPAERPPRPHH